MIGKVEPTISNHLKIDKVLCIFSSTLTLKHTGRSLEKKGGCFSTEKMCVFERKWESFITTPVPNKVYFCSTPQTHDHDDKTKPKNWTEKPKDPVRM